MRVPFRALIVGSLALLIGVPACAGSNAGGPPADKRDEYTEYTCPDPIGKILREDCSKSALQYQGASFEGSVGAAGVGASASYKQSAIREADSLVQLLKEQRVSLCNNFNTCKLTVPEYREEQKHLDDSFVALMALKDRMAQIDAEGAAKLLQELQSIRSGSRAKAEAKSDAKPEAKGDAKPDAKPEAKGDAKPEAKGDAKPAGDKAGFKCDGPALQLFRRGTVAGPSFGYDKTRDALKGHPELSAVKYYEFLLESDTLQGKKQEYLLLAVAPDKSTADTLQKVIQKFSPSAGIPINCPAVSPARTLAFDTN